MHKLRVTGTGNYTLIFNFIIIRLGVGWWNRNEPYSCYYAKVKLQFCNFSPQIDSILSPLCVTMTRPNSSCRGTQWSTALVEALSGIEYCLPQ